MANVPGNKGDTTSVELAGRIHLKQCQLIQGDGVELPIHGFVTQIDIFEDLYSPYITGKVMMNDTNNLLSSLPIIGEEKLKLVYSTPGAADVTNLLS